MRTTRWSTRAAAVVAGVLAVTACTGGGDGRVARPGDDGRGAPEEVRPALVLASSLRAFDDCDALLGYVHDRATDLAGPYGMVGGPVTGGNVLFAREDAAAATVGSGAAGGPAPSRALAPADGYSTTNVQEAGVDEPDLVKTDGELLITTAGGRLHVLDVAGETPATLATMDLGPAWGEPQLLLAGDRVLVLSPTGSDVMPADARRVAGLSRGPAVTTTQVRVVDLSEPSSPRVVSTVDLEGQLLAARLVDGVARVVVRSQPTLRGFTYPADDSPESQRAAEANNRAVVASSSVDDWVPSYAVVDGGGETLGGGRMAECGDVFQPGEPAGAATVTVTSIDPRDPTPRGTASVVGGGELVYATATNLYVTTTEWSPDGTAPATTRIHRFSIADPDGARYEGSGSVPGRLLNQFSMSEHDGVLRVASTVDGATSESVVTTLRVDGLTELGRVGGLGRTEQIHAVRFIGDHGYVVTFRQTDPLYVVDLSDPAAPAVRGELKIPGYSAYLHPVGDDLLLGVGQDADDTGRVRGAQVSLFDVSDPAAPARLATASLGGGWSEVEGDHHAFLWWAPTGLAAVPVQPDGVAGFHVSRADGVREVGRVAAHGWARRAVVVGDRLLTVSDQGVASSDLTTLVEQAFVRW